ncbi:MAG: DNA uptake protein ComE-like DNA-binding protein [Candidatus Paceibacteria bacterium]|jgi:DNA uptake protein ComE-like DNA-binding protein
MNLSPRSVCSTPPKATPAWALAAVGGLCTLVGQGRFSAIAAGPPAQQVSPNLLTSPARDLRRLPGVGPARAAAIAEYRWLKAGTPFELHEIPGIGLGTEARVQKWLATPAKSAIPGEVQER